MSKKIKILIVEDNEDERMFMIEGFTREGHYEIVAEASNGNELVEWLNTKANSIMPEVVLTDLNMPGKNGYDVIAEVKSNASISHIPVVVLTTAPAVPFADRCKKLGACAYYSKPDTFLDYQSFAGKIYQELIKNCLKD
jgi:CheY-like chemotaxis protein